MDRSGVGLSIRDGEVEPAVAVVVRSVRVMWVAAGLDRDRRRERSIASVAKQSDLAGVAAVRRAEQVRLGVTVDVDGPQVEGAEAGWHVVLRERETTVV